MEVTLLPDIVIIFGLSTFVLFVCHWLRIHKIVGFLLTGILAGPHGLRLISAVHHVESLSEIGVLLLLFTIGLEFSFKDLWQSKKIVILGGSLQVFLTILMVFAILRPFGHSFSGSVFVGFLVSLSSTAIVLKLIQERGEIYSPYGRVVVGILIFQDIIIIPMMMATPLLAGLTDNFGQSMFILAGKAVGLLLVLILGAKWIVPKMLYQIAGTRNKELFALSIIAFGFAVAWLTSSLGLSLALGGFLAGLAISESEYSHQALGDVLPLRDVFTSLFFISMGMLLDVSFIFKHLGLILLITPMVLALKSILAGFSTALLGFPFRTTLLAGTALSQIGEFSFVLSKSGVEYGVLAKDAYQLFLIVSVLTMGATPFIVSLISSSVDLILRLPLPQKVRHGLYARKINEKEKEKTGLKDHLIIVGFGVNGRNLARAAKKAGIPYTIIETNPQTVKTEQIKTEPIYYGDATQESMLIHAGVKDARILVVAISDPPATRRIVAITRNLNSKIHIIARTRFVQEMKPLYELGANEVIPEEFETAVEIFTRVLITYLIPREEIERFIAEVRADGYEMFRSISKIPASFSDLKDRLTDIEIAAFRVDGRSSVVNRSLVQIELRKKYGITILAIRHDSDLLTNPDGNIQLLAGDVVIALGSPEKMAKAATLFLCQEE